MPRITIHQTERYHADRSSFSGPTAETTTGWSFTPPVASDLVNTLGLVTDQDLDPGVAVEVDVPEGSRVLEVASGGLALFTPGTDIGMPACDVLALARAGQDGFAMAD